MTDITLTPLEHMEAAKAKLLAPITPELVNRDFSAATAQGMVMAFMVHADQTVRVKPTGLIEDAERARIRRVLSEERQEELFDAMTKGDVVEISDALADSVYVLLSVATSYGICLAPVLREVCSNNYLKTLSPKRVDEFGKLLKPEGHPKPRIKEILDTLADLADNTVERMFRVLVIWDAYPEDLRYFDVYVTGAELEKMLAWNGIYAVSTTDDDDDGIDGDATLIYKDMFDFYDAQDEAASVALAQQPIIGTHYDAIISCGQA